VGAFNKGKKEKKSHPHKQNKNPGYMHFTASEELGVEKFEQDTL
jgi:hypothetical protein